MNTETASFPITLGKDSPLVILNHVGLFKGVTTPEIAPGTELINSATLTTKALREKT